jgi:hypothetical protein
MGRANNIFDLSVSADEPADCKTFIGHFEEKSRTKITARQSRVLWDVSMSPDTQRRNMFLIPVAKL